MVDMIKEFPNREVLRFFFKCLSDLTVLKPTMHVYGIFYAATLNDLSPNERPLLPDRSAGKLFQTKLERYTGKVLLKM